jgi:peptide/nickel transport system permease protein
VGGSAERNKTRRASGCIPPSRQRHGVADLPLKGGGAHSVAENFKTMTAYIIRRLLSMLPVMAIVALFVFLLLHLAPGDPAAIMAGDNATPDNIAQIRQKLGLDEPIWKQFLVWIGSLAQGNLGNSMFWGDPVTTLIAQRAEPTISLAATTIAVAIVIAVFLGVIAAAKAGTGIDRFVMGFAVMGFSVPVFVVGYLLIFLFAIELKWLPVQGYTPIAEGILPWLRNLVLPSVALGLAYVALIARITRATMLDVLSEDYMRTARAKGVATMPLLLKHALKNAAVPIVTVIGIGVALLIGGVVITETVFNIPGIGRLVVDAITRRDYPIIQGVILVFSGIYVLVNLLVDLSYTFFDPRIRY